MRSTLSAPDRRVHVVRERQTKSSPREKLRKITALFEGTVTAGERQAAAAAIKRIRQALKTAV
jgi:hypothetical protein